MNKELRKLITQLEEAGYVVSVPTKAGHYKVYSPDGKMLTVLSGTPSDWRTRLNELRPLKRLGFRWHRG